MRDQEFYKIEIQSMAVRKQQLKIPLRHDLTKITHENPDDDIWHYTGPRVPSITTTTPSDPQPMYDNNWVRKEAYALCDDTTPKAKGLKDSRALNPLTKDEYLALQLEYMQSSWLDIANMLATIV